MKPTDFIAWREYMGYTQAEAARALGMGLRIIGHYEAGTRQIPLTTALSCSALAADLGPWRKRPSQK